MKKFDFSKEFGNIDSKYISEAEEAKMSFGSCSQAEMMASFCFMPCE